MTVQMTRRALFSALPSAAIVLTIPAAVEAKSDTKGDQLQRFLDTASDDDLAQYHASQLARALCRTKPGLWNFNLEHIGANGNFVLFTHTEHPTFVGYVQEFH